MNKNLNEKEQELKKMQDKESEYVKKIEALNKENEFLKVQDEAKNKNESKKTKRDEFYEFLAKEDSFSDVELVKLKDLSHLAPTIEFCFQV